MGIGSNLAFGALTGSIDAALKQTPRQNLAGSVFTGALFAGVDAFMDGKFIAGNFLATLLTTTAASTLTYYAVHGMMSHKAKTEAQHAPKSWVERSCITDGQTVLCR